MDQSVQHQVHGVEELARQAVEGAPLLVPWSAEGGACRSSLWTARCLGPRALVRSLGQIGAKRTRAAASGDRLSGSHLIASEARTRTLVALVAAFRTMECGPKGAALLITLLLDGCPRNRSDPAWCEPPNSVPFISLHTILFA